jgi:short-subunit dehydrogenase
MSDPRRVAIITGASSGIGTALARQLSNDGWSVGLIARRVEVLQTLAQELDPSGQVIRYQAADVQDRQALHKAIHSIEEQLGECDRLFVNAGVGATNSPRRLNVEGAENVIKTNLLGAIYSIEAVLPRMIKQNSGHIIVLSSLAAYKGLPGAAAYCASKAALSSYVESLRIQLHRTNVKFTTVCPGFIDTPMTQKQKGMMFLMKPDRGAKLILKAVDRQKKVYNFPWITTRLMKMTYWLPDWLVAKVLMDDYGGRGAEAKR